MPDSTIHLDKRTYARGLACVHCGLCLPACPTYVTTGHEGDSPRGRIQLMLGLADGKIEATETVRRHLDLCLDCRGCETACPSGVIYHELLEESRARLAESRPPTNQAMRWAFFHVLTRPTRLKLALLPARLLQKIGLYNFLVRKSGLTSVLPSALRKMEHMLPPGRLWPRKLPAKTPSTGKIRNVRADEVRATKTVAFFPGCVGSVFGEQVNQQAVELLAACGADVIISRRQTCCGAIHLHNGADEPAKAFARKNIDAMLPLEGGKIDYICSCIAGCGAMLREYDFLLRGDTDYSWRAKEFVSRVRDISEVLLELGLPPMKHRIDETVTIHDACHLAHAQKVVAAPRKLLAQIPGLKLAPLPDSDLCCGAAGTYNLTEPAMAAKLAKRKLETISATRATICVAGNIGCQMHLQSCAGTAVRFVHPVTLLHRAVFGDS
ncbi:MAG TPA: heterodisulfide reductase-related iron-sulfur binding cluster [Tepidisphaeraceae bacterium]|nr:heterodisulfide reductase-related iron-sulfur binding cluster [Tepidisphaeraceae bacterium]